MKIVRKIIEIDEELCNGCGQCVPACEEGAIEIVDGKARLVAEKYCDGLGACLGECPTGALKIVEREAEDFDEEAVEEWLKQKERREQPQQAAKGPAMACGCPSSMIRNLAPGAHAAAGPATAAPALESTLSHWPVQIRLIPPHAPFLKDADLLITADCVPVALPDYHQRFVPGRVVMLGCPKFDDQAEYVARFTEIFQKNPPKSITVLIMEVPCCSQMLFILKKAMENAGLDTNTTVNVIGLKGDLRPGPAIG